MKPDLKLRAAMMECELHAEVLADAIQELENIRFTEESVVAIPRQMRRLLDQVAYRFAKLQDTLGERCLPGLLFLAEEPLAANATFAEKLQRLERLGAISEAESWRYLREVRNQIAHEYIDQPQLKAASLNLFLASTQKLLAEWKRVQTYYEGLINSSSGH